MNSAQITEIAETPLSTSQRIAEWNQRYFVDLKANPEDSELALSRVAEAFEELTYITHNPNNEIDGIGCLIIDGDSRNAISQFYSFLLDAGYHGFISQEIKRYLNGDNALTYEVEDILKKGLQKEEGSFLENAKEKLEYSQLIYSFLASKVSPEMSDDIKKNIIFSREVDKRNMQEHGKNKTGVVSINHSNARVDYLTDLIETVKTLESDQPGSSAEIYNKFGIRNFGIYGTWGLLKQLRDYPKCLADAQYLTMRALGDYNFGYTANTELQKETALLLKSFTGDDGLPDYTGSVYLEFGSPQEFLRRLLEINSIKASAVFNGDEYDLERVVPINGLYISAHGSTDRFASNAPHDEAHDISVDWLEKFTSDEIASLSAIFDENSVIILSACSVTERARNVSQSLSRVTNTSVVGPSEPLAHQWGDSVDLPKGGEDVNSSPVGPIFTYKIVSRNKSASKLSSIISKLNTRFRNKTSKTVDRPGKSKSYMKGVLLTEN